MALTRRELDDLRPWMSSVTSEMLGFPETAVVSAAMDCVSQNMDSDRMAGEMTEIYQTIYCIEEMHLTIH